uniref:Uncharacterized protein n=1 Tax=Rhizophora mucronata TaxID=61149 RepID=A0A2P2Q0A1_RHIMU
MLFITEEETEIERPCSWISFAINPHEQVIRCVAARRLDAHSFTMRRTSRRKGNNGTR